MQSTSTAMRRERCRTAADSINISYTQTKAYPFLKEKHIKKRAGGQKAVPGSEDKIHTLSSATLIISTKIRIPSDKSAVQYNDQY